MGLLNSLADVATGGALNAGREQRKGINAAMGNVNDATATAKSGLAGGFGQAQSQLGQGFDQARAGLAGGVANATGALQPLADESAGAYGGLLDKYNSGGFDPNNFNYKESPGYQFALTEGEKPFKEMAAGNGRTGAEDKALTQYATGMADQDYGAQFNRNLQAQDQNFTEGQSLAAPAAGLASQIAGLYGQQGQQLATLGQNQGTDSAGLSTGLAGLLASLTSDQGTSLANLNLGKSAVNGGIQTAAYGPLTTLANQGLSALGGSQTARKLGGLADTQGLKALTAMGLG